MRLEELVGKNAVRTKALWFDSNNNFLGVDYEDYEGELSDDDSYTDGQYITVTEVTNKEIKYIQHFGPSKGERTFKFDSKYDQYFLDDNWIEWTK